jgi:hypothetical protein
MVIVLPGTGADANMKNPINNETPLQCCLKNLEFGSHAQCDIVEALVKSGATYDARSQTGQLTSYLLRFVRIYSMTPDLQTGLFNDAILLDAASRQSYFPAASSAAASSLPWSPSLELLSYGKPQTAVLCVLGQFIGDCTVASQLEAPRCVRKPRQ